MNTRNKALIITGVILLIIALAVFIGGGLLAGWDFMAFFHSQTFVWICVLVGMYILTVVAIIIADKIRKL